MKIFLIAILCLVNVCRAQESISVREDVIFTVSSFETVDYFSTLTLEGEFIWEIPFNSQVQSFEVKDDQVFILSKKRNGLAAFITCVSKETGKVAWEKPIFAPGNSPSATDRAEESL